MARLITAPELLLPIYVEAFLFIQCGDAFVTQKKWKYSLDNSDVVGRNVVANEKLNWEVILDGLLRFNERIYVSADSPLRYELLQAFYDASAAGHQGVSKTVCRIAYCY